MTMLFGVTAAGLVVVLTVMAVTLCVALRQAVHRVHASAEELDRVVAVLAARLPSSDLVVVSGRDVASATVGTPSARRAELRAAVLRRAVQRGPLGS